MLRVFGVVTLEAALVLLVCLGEEVLAILSLLALRDTLSLTGMDTFSGDGTGKTVTK